MSSFFSKGGGKSKTPVRTPDNLRSEDTVEFLIGLGEGEIFLCWRYKTSKLKWYR